jgi:hypothetical protein
MAVESENTVTRKSVRSEVAEVYTSPLTKQSRRNKTEHSGDTSFESRHEN